VSASFSQAVLASLLVASFLPALVVLAVRRQDIIALKWHALFLVRSLQQCVCRREAGVTDYSTVVARRLQQRRRGIANIAAVAVASFHLFELVRVCLVEESVCTSVGAPPQLRLFLALLHLGSFWAASLFLVFTHRIGQERSRPDVAFLFVIIVLDVAQTALVGEQALLVESRLYSQLLWRLLLGACISPAVALLGNLLYMLGAGTVYKVLIPDGFLFTVGSTRAGLLYQQGCNQLWSRSDALTGKDLLLVISRLSGLTDVSAIPNLEALLDELLKKQTSFSDFLISEILLVAVVMACLVLLGTLMSHEIWTSLQLQSSEDQLLAVSQIMDRLCDATCQISRDLRICCCSPRLDAILRMSCAGPSAMEGEDFRDVIASEDERASFKAFVDQGIREGFSDALYLDLKCASSMRVRMQLLCARFADVLGQPRVLCGLTELQADGPRARERGAADWAGPLAAPGRAEPRRKRATSEGGASSDTGGSSASGSGSQDELESLVVEVKLDEDLSILRASRAFGRFLGASPSQRDSIKQFLVEPEVVAEHLKGCTEGNSSDESGASSAREVEIVFKTQHQDDRGAVCHTLYRAVCSLVLRKSADASRCAELKLLAVSRLPGSSSPASASSPPNLQAEQPGASLGSSLERSSAARYSL